MHGKIFVYNFIKMINWGDQVLKAYKDTNPFKMLEGETFQRLSIENAYYLFRPLDINSKYKCPFIRHIKFLCVSVW